MALDLVRGFRRIGWVIAVPPAVLIVLVFYDDLREVNYNFIQTVDVGGNGAQKMTVKKITAEIDGQTMVITVEIPDGATQEEIMQAVAVYTGHPLHKRVNKLKLTGLIIGAFACMVLVIQGSISILAWVFRGFKGDVPQGPSG